MEIDKGIEDREVRIDSRVMLSGEDVTHMLEVEYWFDNEAKRRWCEEHPEYTLQQRTRTIVTSEWSEVE